MPFSPKFDPIYEEVLRPAIENVGLRPARADQIYGSRRIMRDVWNSIRTARIVIAELTGRNANVLYELGLSHALGKPFVIITNSMDDVPFDLKDLRCIVYDKDHPKWGDSLTKSVTRTLKSVLEEASEHGPLFSEIQADTKYPPVEEAVQEEGREGAGRAEEQIIDMTGRWHLTQEWEASTNSITIMDIQQSGHSLSGSATTHPSVANESWAVNQQVSGFIRANQFELSATSYQIIESAGETLSWSLDNWRGTVDSPTFIRGELTSESDDTGTFWGERKATEITENKSN